jgi:lipopolysaccharide transport system permease protein
VRHPVTARKPLIPGRPIADVPHGGARRRFCANRGVGVARARDVVTQPSDMSASATKIPSSEVAGIGSAVQPDAGAAGGPSEHELVLQPSRGWIGINWSELIRYRELLFFLVWRDIKVRYKQAVLGVAWAVLQPVITMVVFTAIFGMAAEMGKNIPEGMPYSVFVFTALLPWQLFATSMNAGGLSLVNQQHLLTKIYFPRLFVPTAVVGGALFDMAIASLAYVVLVAIKGGVVVSPWLLLVPVLIAMTVVLATGMAYLLSALTVSYRDFRFLIPFAVQIWMWGSFVAFPIPKGIADNPGNWRWVFALNPMHGIVGGFRKALMNFDQGWRPMHLATSAAISVAVFVLGIFYFRRTERRFADIA